MLRVTIDLIPYRDEKLKRTIGTVTIVNDYTGDVNLGNYDYTIQSDSNCFHGEINKFKREKGAWSLLKEILKHAPIDDLRPQEYRMRE
jgi:hypothetical protein